MKIFLKFSFQSQQKPASPGLRARSVIWSVEKRTSGLSELAGDETVKQSVPTVSPKYQKIIREAVSQLVDERVRKLRHQFSSLCPTHNFQELVQFITFETIKVLFFGRRVSFPFPLQIIIVIHHSTLPMKYTFFSEFLKTPSQ